MNTASSSAVARWRYALKPASWPKLLVPTALGLALGFATSSEWSLGALVFGALFTALDAAFIVLLNDWSDREVDALKRQMFPGGCSQKTIPDGLLPARHVLLGGLLAGLGALSVAGIFAAGLDRPLLLPGAIAALALFVGYSLPPLRLNYRGGGELLEALGVGLALPWLNAYAASGDARLAGAWPVLGGWALLSLASAIASGLSDEQSDRRGGKRTFTTTYGNPWARRAIESLVLAAAGVWAASIFFVDVELKVSLILAASIVWNARARLVATSTSAVTNAFAAQKRYKEILHRGAWRSAMTIAAMLVALRLWWS